jgi:prepilin-type N-terminal cleavage/methylation domain-containing protein
VNICSVTARKGFTLIELLIVIGIISLLVQIAIPAIEMSREAARQTQCSNNLRQLALAFQIHHDTYRHFPSSGWGWQWVGHPDRGYGKDQPGGWAYNILPFIEQEPVRKLGSGLSDGSREQQIAIFKANATPIALFNCPSRRLPRAYPMILTGFKPPLVGFSPLLPQECRDGDSERCKLARSDYAVNSGNLNPGTEPGPNTLDEAESWLWKYSGANVEAQNGISHQRSQVTAAQITDGLTKTYCIGEKYIPAAEYRNGYYQNDNQSLFVAHDGDMNRYTADVENKPRKITPDSAPANNQQFGSAHPTLFHMSFCDGSVQGTSYEIDPEVHRFLGGRDDGLDASDLRD